MIKDKNIAPGAGIDPGKIGYVTGPRRADGTMPRTVYVSKGGFDGNNNGAKDQPFKTIQFAHDSNSVADEDVIVVGPGVYDENVTFTKRVSLIGAANNPGAVQIVGSSTGTSAALTYSGGSLGNVLIANFEVGNQVANYPGLVLESSDDASYTTTLSEHTRFTVRNVRCQDDNLNVGILIKGAQAGDFYDLQVTAAQIGIGFSTSLLNVPSDLTFNDVLFYDNVTADVATLSSVPAGGAATIGAIGDLSNINFFRAKFMDRGGTPVTNFVNFPAATCVNVGFYDFLAARDVADGTLMALPANVIAVGHSAAGVESIIGS